MKLTATEMVSLDGVFQGPGGPDLELIDSRTSTTGVMIQTFRPKGQATFRNAG